MAFSTIETLRNRMIENGSRRMDEIDTLINRGYIALQDMTGRAIYAKLYTLTQSTRVQSASYPDR